MLHIKRDIHQLLLKAFELGASDLHVSPGSPPMLRMDGALAVMQEEEVSPEDVKLMAQDLMGPRERERFEQEGEVDFSTQIESACRFRLNVFRQQHGVAIAARLIPAVVPDLAQLGLPPVIRSLTQKPHGLVLVTGPTGSGKSSTLAALIDHINHTQHKHIITLEDPIEYIHNNMASLIQQREIGSDTTSFAQGLRAALRQDPDVILVGELRDLETISAAVTAAETGHLVLGTLHTTDAPQTIDRIIDAFPGHQQGQIRIQLAGVLNAIVSQRLLPRKAGGGRICVTEVMINTPAVANLIRSEKNHQIRNLMLTGKSLGMHTMDMSIREQLQTGVIDAKTAQPYLAEGGS
ncbi:type IV pilus twitching motility protein PilT [Paenibacillus dokdonensis]|uniref:Type IV pilus twitching motility protein PilT n=1 Tax=Paenibacillus dokdonensis TaxID=2567944 RepID=A0ABU6GNY6_9BACL|nr:type IV pilus twitching motility protein PilT [Paenibacillus dokdonensis]MEC0241443.1 type IV pilus twitching motility protein PilT [Paenibacillus dokdonensis]